MRVSAEISEEVIFLSRRCGGN